jgi:hypothetical protein
MPAEGVDLLFMRIVDLEQQLAGLQSKVQELEIELRGTYWGVSNAEAERSLIHHRDLPDEDDA